MKVHLVRIACLLAGLGSGLAVADMPQDLTILRDGCRVFDASAAQVFTTAVQVSSMPSDHMMMYTCTATGVGNTTGHDVEMSSANNPTPCGISTPPGYVVAESWKETINTGGAATLTCQYKRTGQ